jgi:hypothetical protein
MVSGLARGMVNGKDNEYESKKSEDNFIANRKFKSCYNIKILNRFMEKKYVIFIELYIKVFLTTPIYHIIFNESLL